MVDLARSFLLNRGGLCCFLHPTQELIFDGLVNDGCGFASGGGGGGGGGGGRRGRGGGGGGGECLYQSD